MDVHTFNKLVEMLRPISSSGTSITQVRSERNTERERKRIEKSHGEFCVCVRKPNPAWFSHSALWYSSTTNSRSCQLRIDYLIEDE